MFTFDEIEARLHPGPFTKDGPWLFEHELRKINKRLWVVRRHDGAKLYTPPDFIQIIGRTDFDRMLGVLNRGARLIDAIMAFEARARVKAFQPPRGP